jgi:hypothetical protein
MYFEIAVWPLDGCLHDSYKTTFLLNKSPEHKNRMYYVYVYIVRVDDKF